MDQLIGIAYQKRMVIGLVPFINHCLYLYNFKPFGYVSVFVDACRNLELLLDPEIVFIYFYLCWNKWLGCNSSCYG